MLPLPHENPQIDPRTRFRLQLQVEQVRDLCKSARLCKFVSHFPSEVRRYQQKYSYGFLVAKTTIYSLFQKHKIDWSEEDDEKVNSGYERAACRKTNDFWARYLTPPPLLRQNLIVLGGTTLECILIVTLRKFVLGKSSAFNRLD